MTIHHECACGCGQNPGVWDHNNVHFGRVKGQPRRFVHGHNTRKPDFVEDPLTGCWIWQKNINRDGYGLTGVRPADYKPGDGYKTTKAMKVYWERVNGPVPPGLVLDHFMCDNRACVRPDHVRPVTVRENTLRGNAPSSWNMAKTCCSIGHEFTPANTYEYKGTRSCRICRALASGRYRERCSAGRTVA